ncbi:MAG TPA: Rad52/Rad22 family DNA repair protein [Candidatus Acidoferrales bacterium]|nr:Rad52/Rad22 family DNA repair protein [Candidatus Acidoferrales bacterium]
MSFSTKQINALKRNLDHRFVRSREAGGRTLSYIEGWYAVAQANRIFGFDGWSRETIDPRCVLSRENRGNFLVVYTAKVRVTAHADGATVVREAHGSGEGRGSSPGEVHDIALKAAETDATKRALATFGRPFGLELYRNGRPTTVAGGPNLEAPALQPDPAAGVSGNRIGFHPDDTTPIPRPSHYYGRRQQNLLREAFPVGKQVASDTVTIAPEIASAEKDELPPARIDKSQLTIAEPKRLRDKAHLRFVASKSCLICGRQPCDPHHLRFAQPRAIGMKVSDEFTVPLCRGHHRELHQAGNEVAWWKERNITPLPIAKELWDESHFNSHAENTPSA